MPLTGYFPYTPGATLLFSVRRESDKTYLDFADGTFKSVPTTLTSAATEGTGNNAGEYTALVSSTPAGPQWTDGDFTVRFHDTALSNRVVGINPAVISNGSDATVIPSGGGVAPPSAAQVADAVWDEILSGHVLSGSAGAGLTAASAGGGSGGSGTGTGDELVGLVADSSNPLALAVSGLTADCDYAGQRLYNRRTGEDRVISASSYDAGTGLHTFTFSSGSKKDDRPFSNVMDGDEVAPL
jgi:hypothetical protein